MLLIADFDYFVYNVLHAQYRDERPSSECAVHSEIIHYLDVCFITDL